MPYVVEETRKARQIRVGDCDALSSEVRLRFLRGVGWHT